MHLADQQAERLAHVIRENLSAAVAAYPAGTPGTFNLVWSLQGITDPTIVPLLKKALTNKDPEVRYAAMEAFMHFTDPALKPLLASARKDRSSRVRTRAKQWIDTRAPDS